MRRFLASTPRQHSFSPRHTQYIGSSFSAATSEVRFCCHIPSTNITTTQPTQLNSSHTPFSSSALSFNEQTSHPQKFHPMPRYLTQSEAIALDEELMRCPSDTNLKVDDVGTSSSSVGHTELGVGYCLEQLMELAGLACAQAIDDHIRRLDTEGRQKSTGSGGDADGSDCTTISASKKKIKSILVVCGPGNNGGDGIVAARYLRIFKPGVKVTLWIPKLGKNQFFSNLLLTASLAGVSIVNQCFVGDSVDATAAWISSEFDYIVDAIFGFSFKAGEVREPYKSVFHAINRAVASSVVSLPIISIDIPSGWDVERGKLTEKNPSSSLADAECEYLSPVALISLTCPKKFAETNLRKSGIRHHYLGGRFVPSAIEEKYQLGVSNLYTGSELYTLLPCD